VQGLTARLKKVGQPDLAAANVTVGSFTQATGTFDITGCAAGIYDLYVRNSDGQSSTKAAAFQITATPRHLLLLKGQPSTSRKGPPAGIRPYFCIQNPGTLPPA